jgi:hypothetical protein
MGFGSSPIRSPAPPECACRYCKSINSVALIFVNMSLLYASAGSLLITAGFLPTSPTAPPTSRRVEQIKAITIDCINDSTEQSGGHFGGQCQPLKILIRSDSGNGDRVLLIDPGRLDLDEFELYEATSSAAWAGQQRK